MNLKKAFLLIVTLLLTLSNAFAQEDDEKQPETTKAVPGSKLVWRTLNISKDNPALKCIVDDKGNKTDFNNFLSHAVKSHATTAYSINDGLNNIDTLAPIWHYSDIQKTGGPATGFDKLENVDAPALYTSDIYFIAEYWKFVNGLNKMVCTIEWIGPCGTDEQGNLKPLFAVKFDDILPLLGKYTLCNFNNDSKYGCIDFFEARAFVSKIIMTSRAYIAAPKDAKEADDEE